MDELEGFDAYVVEHDVQPGEMGEAFAAYLNGQTGWNGKSERVE